MGVPLIPTVQAPDCVAAIGPLTSMLPVTGSGVFTTFTSAVGGPLFWPKLLAGVSAETTAAMAW